MSRAAKSKKVAPQRSEMGKSTSKASTEQLRGPGGKEWSVQLTTIHVPQVDVRKIREKMGSKPIGLRLKVWIQTSFGAQLGAAPS